MDTSKRLLSLDAFRGITIAGMILVNNPGSWSSVYPPLLHADWHGVTPTDWIFPFFLFIVGISIALALGKRKDRGDDHKAIVQKIIKRTLIIFAIGLFLNLFPKFNFGTVRIPGVLQRIALVYGACALIFLKTNWKTQLWISAGLLLGYWALMTLVPVPGGGAPSLEPSENLGAWLDRTLMSGHLWSQSKTWDPEGLLSTLPAIVTGMSGVFTGMWLRTSRNDYEKLTGIFAVGVLLLSVAFVWDMVFPFNKKIWTSSFVLFTSGVALLFLGLVYWLIDVQGYKRWSKAFVVYGMNALFVFVMSGLVAKLLYTIKLGNGQTLQTAIYESLFTPFLSPINASLGYAILNVLFFLALAWILYSRKIFIKV